jgi:hypothetical protein
MNKILQYFQQALLLDPFLLCGKWHDISQVRALFGECLKCGVQAITLEELEAGTQSLVKAGLPGTVKHSVHKAPSSNPDNDLLTNILRSFP